jgi:hypothetical protein
MDRRVSCTALDQAEGPVATTADAAAKTRPSERALIAALARTRLGCALRETVANLTLVFANIDLASLPLGTFFAGPELLSLRHFADIGNIPRRRRTSIARGWIEVFYEPMLFLRANMPFAPDLPDRNK